MAAAVRGGHASLIAVKVMSMLRPALLAGISSFLATACMAGSPSPGAGNSSYSSSSRMAQSQGSMSGQNGVITVGDDVVQVKDGRLSLNGVAYGTVRPDSQVSYTVRGQEKQLRVDGRLRLPER